MKSSYDLFASIWEQHHIPLYKYLFSRMSNQYDAEDVLQTTALKAARNFHNLKNLKDAKTWLFSIATNAMNDQFRRNGTNVSIEHLPEVIAADSTNGFSDLKFTLYTYLDKLPAQKQNLFYLYMQKTLNLKEIAGVLGIGYSTARKWLQEMKDELTEELYDSAQ
jgi:RNA polymerase sigma-70 factor (ECF subfamily)